MRSCTKLPGKSVYPLSELANITSQGKVVKLTKWTLWPFPAVLFLFLSCPIVLVLSYFLTWYNPNQIGNVHLFYFSVLGSVKQVRCKILPKSSVSVVEDAKKSQKQAIEIQKYYVRGIIKTSKDWTSELTSKPTPMWGCFSIRNTKGGMLQNMRVTGC